MDHWVYIPLNQEMVHQRGNSRDSIIQQVRQKGTDHAESKIEYQSHNTCKTGDSSIFSSKDLVHFHAAQVFFAFSWLNYRSVADLLNKVKTHMGNGGSTVQAALCFHLLDDMLDHLFFIFIQI